MQGHSGIKCVESTKTALCRRRLTVLDRIVSSLELLVELYRFLPIELFMGLVPTLTH